MAPNLRCRTSSEAYLADLQSHAAEAAAVLDQVSARQ